MVINKQKAVFPGEHVVISQRDKRTLTGILKYVDEDGCVIASIKPTEEGEYVEFEDIACACGISGQGVFVKAGVV